MINSKTCKHCGKIFEKPYGLSKKQWLSRMFCSKRCGATRRDVKKDIEISRMYKNGMSCLEISIEVGISEVHVARIIKLNGDKTEPYKIKKGGISITDNGYIRFHNTKSNGCNAGRRLHDVIAEMKIGRRLRQNEVVHHKDGNKMNNHPDNLEVMTRGQHTTLHKKQECYA